MAGKCLYRTSLYFRTVDLHETNILSTNRTTETQINYVSKQFTGLGVLLQWLLAGNLGITEIKTYKKWQSNIILECIFKILFLNQFYHSLSS